MLTNSTSDAMNRRLYLEGVATTLTQDNTTEPDPIANRAIRNNVFSFRLLDWQQYCDNIFNRATLVDITSRALHFWSEDQAIYRLYPMVAPLSEDLTRNGRTDVIQKVVAPQWRPTPAMRERNPGWPEMIEGGSPDNLLGTHADYLGWTYCRIHGTHDTRKIGRRSSNGRIGVYKEHIQELFAMAKVGAQVLLI